MRCQSICSLFLAGILLLVGCSSFQALLEGPDRNQDLVGAGEFAKGYKWKHYEKFTERVHGQVTGKRGTTPVLAIDSLPKDAYGNVNWTVAVMNGLLNPRGSLDPDAEEDPPLDLNVFIEAKVPVMNNVLFPHSIHTYWLSCNNCHPSIFIPEAGANPITMDEIFEGKWCGRCHGKVAFGFGTNADPKGACNRCHMIPKGKSLQGERWR